MLGGNQLDTRPAAGNEKSPRFATQQSVKLSSFHSMPASAEPPTSARLFPAQRMTFLIFLVNFVP